MYERKSGNSALAIKLDFPFNITNQPKYLKNEQPAKNTSKNALAETFHKVLLENYTPASLLLNEKGEILYVSGNTGKYIQLHPGEAVMDIHRMAREELKYAIGNALHQAMLQRSKIEVSDARIKVNGKVHRIGFSVEYLSDYPLNDLLLLTFEDKGPLRKRSTKAGKSGDPTRDGAIEELERELIYTKQQLHTTIEQMETSLEELKSTNEELQSTNEELQSTNEEALTTKEEMQSLNEELMTINLQYQNKAEELSQLNNDMKNLLDNTEIGTIFLDNDLNILRYTPQVTKLFNVISTDVGRSITHIVSNFDYPSIEKTIMEVIQKLMGRELEVKTKSGDWYNMRIMPYRTMDNFISGAVLTFTRITPVKAMERRLQSLVSYVGVVLEEIPEACVIMTKERQVLATNTKFLKSFGFRSIEVVEQSLLEIVHNHWNTSKLDEFLMRDDDGEMFVQLDHMGIGLKNLTVIKKTITDNKKIDAIRKVIFREQ